MKCSAKTSLAIVLEKILVEEMREFGQDKFSNCLRIFLVEEMREFGKDKF